MSENNRKATIRLLVVFEDGDTRNILLNPEHLVSVEGATTRLPDYARDKARSRVWLVNGKVYLSPSTPEEIEAELEAWWGRTLEA